MIDVKLLNQIADQTGITAALRGGPAYPSAAPRGVIPPPPERLNERNLIAAILAAGMIAAGGREVTAEQAVGVWREVRNAVEGKATPGAWTIDPQAV